MTPAERAARIRIEPLPPAWRKGRPCQVCGSRTAPRWLMTDPTVAYSERAFCISTRSCFERHWEQMTDEQRREFMAPVAEALNRFIQPPRPKLVKA